MATQPTTAVPQPAQDWLAQALAGSVLARELYEVEYRATYAWNESNETEGPGADLERRRSAYARYTELDARLWPAMAQLRRADPFLVREIMVAADAQAHATYQAARAVLLAGPQAEE